MTPTRRRYLQGLSLGGAGVLSGCSGALDPPAETSTSPGNTTSPIDDSRSRVTLPIPTTELDRAAPRDAIPAIIEPVFASDWSGISITVQERVRSYTTEPRLGPDDLVVGLTDDTRARAYPLRVLNWHEIVNDDFGGPLLVTYCPLCRSGLVTERSVNGETTIFGVSRFLWNENLVMYDRATDSLWSQLRAQAIHGPRSGDSLRMLPSTLTTWKSWRDRHSKTEVLLPSPMSKTVSGAVVRNYTINPYVGYDRSRTVGVDGTFDDERLHPKALVLGIEVGETARAYPFERVATERVINDEVGGRPIVVAVGSGEAMVAYDRTVDGRVLRFGSSRGNHLRAGGSSWRLTDGVAVDGPHEGTGLAPTTNTSAMFWFAWLKTHPKTDVFI